MHGFHQAALWCSPASPRYTWTFTDPGDNQSLTGMYAWLTTADKAALAPNDCTPLVPEPTYCPAVPQELSVSFDGQPLFSPAGPPTVIANGKPVRFAWPALPVVPSGDANPRNFRRDVGVDAAAAFPETADGTPESDWPLVGDPSLAGGQVAGWDAGEVTVRFYKAAMPVDRDPVAVSPALAPMHVLVTPRFDYDELSPRWQAVWQGDVLVVTWDGWDRTPTTMVCPTSKAAVVAAKTRPAG